MKSLILPFTFLLLITASAQSDTGTFKKDSAAINIQKLEKSDSVDINVNRIYFNLPTEEKNWWSDWLPFIAAVLGAIIVAVAAYRGVIKQSKASSVSGFRVKWIEDLRESYCNFLISLRNVDSKIRQHKIEMAYAKDEDLEQLNFLKTKIKLMINHNEPIHIAFWEALTRYMQEHNEYYRGDFSEEKENELDNRRVQMEELLLDIFKKEWEKAKNFG